MQSGQTRVSVNQDIIFRNIVIEYRYQSAWLFDYGRVAVGNFLLTGRTVAIFSDEPYINTDSAVRTVYGGEAVGSIHEYPPFGGTVPVFAKSRPYNLGE